MSFPPEFLDEIRLRTPLSDTIGKRVALRRRGREFVGLCPFHKEKTPSFTVNEEKGFWHCFGCGAHGDVIGFEMRMDNLGFPEAVERLARNAGIAIPARGPEEREKARQRTSLYGVLEAACAWFEGQLAAPGGKAARDYLAERGVEPATAAAFRLGWAPNSRAALRQGLKGDDVGEAMMVDAGLLIQPEDGDAPYDRFRGRIMFPITDRGGRVVGFGGRGLGDATPKYLNSPETALFHKGRLLYGVAQARAAARDAGEAIVVEGYMDVIALARAGFENAVAPLGTALTETQIEELWRLAPEPIVCFDGDDAGRRAAQRAAERALPLLRPGRSLRFVALPAGEDPDSLIAGRGAQALRDELARARPLADMLWDMEVGGRRVDTPERRAALEARLFAHARRIHDATVRRHYEDYFKPRLWQAFRGGARRDTRAKGGTRRGAWAPRPPEPALADPLGSGTKGIGARRERLLTSMLLAHPELIARVEEEFAAVAIATPELDRLRDAVLQAFAGNPALDSETLRRHLSARGFSSIVDRLLAPRDWSRRRLEDGVAKPGEGLSHVEAEWRHVLARHERAVTLVAELESAERDLANDMTEKTFARFQALRREIELMAGDETESDELFAGADR